MAPPEPVKSEYVSGQWRLQARVILRGFPSLLKSLVGGETNAMLLRQLCYSWLVFNRSLGKGIHSRLCIYSRSHCPSQGIEKREITNLRLEIHQTSEMVAFFVDYNGKNVHREVVVNEDIGRQILTYGCRKPAKEFINAVHEQF
ncbi:hypothetical protein SELMODRAFT_420945 [Selaginella moellendorffii]|uniref:Uncharacterized protein n=1 Tax=Selaginella moellendorffii TaxID=88036 RepID=D8SDM6_SELML|nr:hypothetical protein SELMODRAFT_420945 [Selaginella moellendorffii]